MPANTILYLHMIESDSCRHAKLAGIRRYAAVGFMRPHEWSRERIRAFAELVRSQGAECRVLEARRGEGIASYAARIRRWVRTLPNGCAVFAVQGPTARHVAAAARAARRDIPGDMTLLSTVGVEKWSIPPPPGISLVQFDYERIGYLTARALAARFPGSRRLFEMRFREAMGHSVLDEILHVRMEKAFTLLAKTGTAIGAIPRPLRLRLGQRPRHPLPPALRDVHARVAKAKRVA